MHGYPRTCEQGGEATPDDTEQTPMVLTIATIVTRHDLCSRIGGASWGGTRCVSPKVGERQKEEHRGKKVQRPVLVLLGFVGHPSLLLRVSTTLSVDVFHPGSIKSKLCGYNMPIDSSTNLPFLECNIQEFGVEQGNVKCAPAKVWKKISP